MTPPPPRSTLFPYTTLIRSAVLGGRPRGARIRVARAKRRAGGRRTDRARDRKSTRLNSSHLGISYAVFCLKKKKEKFKQNTPRMEKLKVERPNRATADRRNT